MSELPPATFRNSRGINDGRLEMKMNVLYKKNAPLLKVVVGVNSPPLFRFVKRSETKRRGPI